MRIRSLLSFGAAVFVVMAVAVLAMSFMRPNNPKALEVADLHHNEHVVKLSDQQIEAGNFAVADVTGGTLSKRFTVPGTIVASGDRIAKVSVRLLGTVAELRRQLGDMVEPGDVLAVIESREIADAKSGYLAARLVFDLQQTLFNRSKSLFDSKVVSENEYLRARATFLDIEVKFESARQKLFALGITDEQIAALPDQAVANLRLQELRAPIKGRIAERRVDLGSLVGREGQESELFVIVDTSVVWAELAVSSAALSNIKEGQHIIITAGDKTLPATIKFISPVLDKDTRFARVIGSVENADGFLRPGSFIAAEISHQPVAVEVMTPKTALQTVAGGPSVFVRSAEGFEKRSVGLGRDDGRFVEIKSGLTLGDKIATANTFVLKADLGKAEAEH